MGDSTGRLSLSQCGPKFNLLLIFLFDKQQTELAGKQSVINPMGMFTVSSGMPLNPQRSINGPDPNRLREHLAGENRNTLGPKKDDEKCCGEDF